MGENSDQEIMNEMNNTATTFDNLTILKELGNIANLVRDEDFLETVPKAKLRRVKWMPMFNFLKQEILDDMVQELNGIWKFEKMAEKIEVLEKQKEKFGDTHPDVVLWRPQLGDVKAQLKAHDYANLQKQKKLLESLANEYENRVNKLKKTISARRGYLKALQLDIQKYQKKNEYFITKINDRLENHQNLVESMAPTKVDVERTNWSELKQEYEK